MNLSIGASNIAAVLGVDPWKSPQQLYNERVSDTPFEGNEHTARGLYLEPGLCLWYLDLARAEDVADTWSSLLDIRRDSKGQLRLKHPAHDWAHATPDLVVRAVPVCGSVDGPKFLTVDVKCPTSASKKAVGGGWVKTWDEGQQVAPLHYRAQVLWQIHLTQLAGIPVTGGELAAGPIFGKLHRIFVAPDAEWFELAFARAAEFHDCLKHRKPLPSHFTQQEQENT